MGTLGFEVAEVGRGGSESVSGVSPGMNNVTTFRIDVEFYQILLGFSSCPIECARTSTLTHPGGGASAET